MAKKRIFAVAAAVAAATAYIVIILLFASVELKPKEIDLHKYSF